jgi:hypothetical protein
MSILFAGKSQGCEQYHFHQAFVPLIDYMDADVYGLGLQFTTVNRSSQILTEVGLHFSGLLTVYSVIGISVGETDQASRC